MKKNLENFHEILSVSKHSHSEVGFILVISLGPEGVGSFADLKGVGGHRPVACCLRTLNNSNNIQCKIDINSNAKLKSQRNIFVWNDDWSSYLDLGPDGTDPRIQHTWILDLMELIIESNIWNLNIPPIFITKSLDSNSKERWFSTRIIATDQNDTNKLYQQKIKINNSL